jgi:hypothetical protein
MAVASISSTRMGMAFVTTGIPFVRKNQEQDAADRVFSTVMEMASAWEKEMAGTAATAAGTRLSLTIQRQDPPIKIKELLKRKGASSYLWIVSGFFYFFSDKIE